MKNLKKLLFSFAAGAILSTQALNAHAEEFTKLDIGAGRTILAYSDITWGQNKDGNYFVRLDGAYPIKNGEVFAIYGSQNFIGDFDKVETVDYTMYYDDGTSDDLETTWVRGGWYATAYIENDTGEDCYVQINDFGVPKGMLSDDIVEELDIRRVNQVGEFNFDGFSAYAESSKYYTTDKSYTLVVSNEIELTRDDIIDNFYCVDNGMIIKDINVTEWNYEQKPGNYYANIFVRDNHQNTLEYKLDIMVYEKKLPQIVGPDEYEILMSKISNFDVDDIYAQYSGDYYNQEYSFALSDDDINKIYNRMSFPNNFEIELECEFASGEVIYKNITINVVDDVKPELFIKKNVYLTEELSKMTMDEIVIMVEHALSEQGILATEIALSDECVIPTKEGDFKLEFTYNEDGQVKNGILNLSVVNSNKLDPKAETIIDVKDITKAYDKDALLHLIENKLLNKGIVFTNLTITSDTSEIPSQAGSYDITFTYESDGVCKSGQLNLMLEDEVIENTTPNNYYIYYIIGGAILFSLSIIIIIRAKKRRHN